MLRIIGLVAVLALTGCPKQGITIHRSLSEPGAMKTCDANKRFRAEVKGSDAKDAKHKAEEQIRTSVKTNGGCGAFIFNEASGKALDGTTNHVADYQLCSCGS
jgi:hypothetical protein